MYSDKNLVNFYKKSKAKSLDFVVAFIVSTDGSTFKKSGDMMIINSEDEFYGVISGGCFEDDMLDCAHDLLAKNSSKKFTYDFRVDLDSEDWGKGVGCNGAIELFVKPFYSSDYSVLDKMILNDNQDDFMILSLESETFEFTKENNDNVILKKSGDIKISKCIEHGGNRYLINRLFTITNLLILGAGPGARDISILANFLGWNTIVCEDREAYSYFTQDADMVVQTTKELKQISFDAIVIMSHNYNKDLEYLREAKSFKYQYIGIIGPKVRGNKLLDAIDANSDMRTKMHSPIGLNLGGGSTKSIALSICSEIEAVLNNRTEVDFLKNTNTPIHS